MKKAVSLLLCLALLAGLTLSVSAVTADKAASGDNVVYLALYRSPDDLEPTVYAECERGAVPVRPAEPGEPGMTFIDWYTEKELKHRFDFTKPLYEDVDLYARFVPTVNAIGVNVFDSPDAEYPFYGYMMVRGELAEYQYPLDVDDDQEFLGWYSDRALTKEFDFSKPVYDYLYLFPKIVNTSDLCYCDMYLSPDDEFYLTSFAIVKGETMSRPGDPGRDGVYFAGWYYDRACTEPVDYTKPCYEDFEIFARWVEDSDLLPYLLGDADGNGEVEVVDATLVQRYDAHMSVNYSEEQMMHADVNADGELDIIDATNIQRYAAMMKTKYAIGSLVYPD